LAGLKAEFRLLCFFVFYLLVLELVADTYKLQGLWEPLLRFLPFCGVAIVAVLRGRALLKPNRVTWLMLLFLVVLFIVLAMGVTRKIPVLSEFPIIGSKSRHFHNVVSFLLQVAAACFLAGGYFLLEELVQGKALVQEQLQKLQQIETVLAESEARFRTLVEHAPDGIYVQTEGRFVYVNSTALAFFGATTSDQLVDKPVLARCPPGDQAAFQETLRLLEQERRSIPRSEQRFLRLDGSMFEVAADAVPFVFKGQNSALVFFRDITERKRLEDQLRQAQKMEAIGQLAGGVAHDFNNLMTVIEGYCGLLLEEHAGQTGKLDGLKHIAQAARRASDLTQQLLMFSRQKVVQMLPLDVNTALHDLEPMLTRLLGEDITVRFDMEPQLPPVEADLGMLEQVVMNLSTNARDAMPKGGTLTFRTELLARRPPPGENQPEAEAGQFVCLSVVDTGCGMDDATLKRVFEPFFTTKDVGKGTGLGLATVYGIVKQHKGWVEVTSEIGRGSSFHVFLPAATTTALPSATPLPRRELRHGQETILVVEDEPHLREMLNLCLRTRGYQVLAASNGPEALAVWERQGPAIDLLFTDMLMPGGLTGRELADRLRADKSNLKVVISSGYSQEMSQHGAPAGKGITFLPKPYQLTTLAETVRKALDEA
jgi:PAS domain S-box-containing protein